MRRQRRSGLVTAMAFAAAMLTSCVGIGAVDQGSLTSETQSRGGGVTTDLVDDAVAAVAAETGADPLEVHSITAELAAVTIVVPATDGSGGREQWRYGTSGLYGGKGLDGPAAAEARGQDTFPVRVGDLEVDEAVDTARAAGDPGAWVDELTVARPAAGAEPVTTVTVTSGSEPTTVVVGGDGAVVPEVPR